VGKKLQPLVDDAAVVKVEVEVEVEGKSPVCTSTSAASIILF